MAILPDDIDIEIKLLAEHVMRSLSETDYSCATFVAAHVEPITYDHFYGHGSYAIGTPENFLSGFSDVLVIYKRTDNRPSLFGFKYGKSLDTADIVPTMLVTYDHEHAVYKIALGGNIDFIGVMVPFSCISDKFQNIVIEDMFVYEWDTSRKEHFFFFGQYNVHLWFAYYELDDMALQALQRFLGKCWKISNECLKGGENGTGFSINPWRMDLVILRNSSQEPGMPLN